MRKLIWGSTALAVAMAAAVYTTADYAARHPESLVGRCANVADHVGRVLNPFSVLSEAVARHKAAQQVVAVKPACAEDDPFVFVPKPEQDCQPQNPPEAGDAVEAIEVIKVEPAEGIDPQAIAEAVGVPFHSHAGRVQDFEEEACEPLPQPAEGESPETREPVQYGVIPGPEEEEPQGNAADNDNSQGALVMPYAEEDDDTDNGCGFCRWMGRLFQSVGIWNPSLDDFAPADFPGPENTTEEEQPVEQGDTTPSEDGAVKDGEDSQDNQEDQSQYHHRYESCPYLHGCPYPYSSNSYHCPGPSTPTTEAPADNQPVKPVKPRKVKKPANDNTPATPPDSDANASPTHPDIDTLEYRPSDGDPNAYTDMWF